MTETEHWSADMAEFEQPMLVRPAAARKMLGGIGTATLWKLINSGELESYTQGKSRLISVKSMHNYVQRRVAAADAERIRNRRPTRPSKRA